MVEDALCKEYLPEVGLQPAAVKGAGAEVCGRLQSPYAGSAEQYPLDCRRFAERYLICFQFISRTHIRGSCSGSCLFCSCQLQTYVYTGGRHEKENNF